MKKYLSSCWEIRDNNWRGVCPQCRTRLFPLKDKCTPAPGTHRGPHEAENTTDWKIPPYFQMCKRYWHNRVASRALIKDNPLFLLMLIFSFICAMKYAWEMLWLSIREKKIQESDLKKVQEDFVSCQVNKLQLSSHLITEAA